MAAGVVPFYIRFLPPLLVLFTTLLSLTLYSMRNSRYTGPLLHYVLSDRATVSLIIQFLSSCLGMAQILICTLVFNFTTNLYILKNPISIGKLSLFAALSVPRTDMTLPWHHLSLVIIALAAAQIPGALWAGSLTPILTPVSVPGMIQIPTFTEESKGTWDAQFIYNPDDLGEMERIGYLLDQCKSSPSKTRVFSCPVPYLQGPILMSASFASSLTGEPRKHSKIDHPSWSYIGRSYGVGSSSGWVSPSISHTLAYNYTEFGYAAKVHCTKNSSSNFGIMLVPNERDERRVAVWEVAGYLPNSIPGNREHYPSITWGTKGATEKPNLLAWSAVVNNHTELPEMRNMIAIAAGEPYVEFNQTQCSVFFEPTKFRVAVNASEQVISVTPESEGEGEDIEKTGRLTSIVIWSLNLLSRMTPSLYESTLANTLQGNVATMLARKIKYSDETMAEEEVRLRAIEESFEAMIDDILVPISASQIIHANSTMSVPVTAEVQGLRIGQERYIVYILMINVVLLILVWGEAGWTRAWDGLTAWNYADIKSVIAACSSDVRKAAERTEEGVRSVRVKVEDHKRGGAVLEVVEEGGNGEHELRKLNRDLDVESGKSSLLKNEGI